MSIYTALTTGGGADAIGTTFPTFRVGLLGPTFYTGTADPTITPPTPMDDGLKDGDIYVRTSGGAAALWVFDSATWTQIASGSTGGSFAGDIIMEPSAQLLGDETAGAGAPAFSFDGDIDTGMFQGSPNEISFATGSTERLIIESDGTIAVTTVDYENLVLDDDDIPNRKYVEDTFINGAGDTMTGDLTLDTGIQLLADDGSSGAPSMAFSSEPDTGFYLDSANVVGVSAGGSEIANFNADGMQMRNGAQFVGDTGTIAIPSISFNGDLNTGIFHDATGGEFAFTSDGTETIRFDGSTATGSLLWNGPDGAVGTPAISFSGDLDTGFYRTGSGSTGYSSDGVNVLTLNSTEMTGSLLWRGPDGAVGAPVLSFSSDDDTGFYHTAQGTIGYSSDGVQTVSLSVRGVRAIGGNATNPGYSFLSDTNSGMFSGGDNIIRFGTDGASRWVINASGHFTPFINNTYDIGTSGLRAATVYATTFDGTATAAQYSDLAERYSIGDCCKLEPGDVVVICEHDDHDICLCGVNFQDTVLGVVSTNPAFMMNKDAGDDQTAPYIALRGRVPVKVYGTVKKGDLLVTCGWSDKTILYPGFARALTEDEKTTVSPHAVFAKALANQDDEWGLVEAVIL